MPRVRRPALLLPVLVVAAAGCGAGTATTSVSSAPVARHISLPAGPTPSISARKVCHDDAIHDISSALGIKPSSVTTPTWVNHLYSCQYRYPNGTLVLQVKELDNKAQTTDYFEQLSRQMGDTGRLTGLGQGAYSTTNGSVVVRKDYKVLLVDIAALPPRFGVPATSSADVAVTVADVIMGCWTGA